MLLEDSIGAFGSLTVLTSMLEARNDQIPSLNSDNRFSGLVAGANKDAPIWGVAVGSAVADWFRAWMPNQGNIKLDWGKVFGDVNSLTYSVVAGDNVTLGLKMDCKSPDSAASLRQVLEGLKLAQQIAWDSQNPGKPNPYRGMEVGLSSNQVSLSRHDRVFGAGARQRGCGHGELSCRFAAAEGQAFSRAVHWPSHVRGSEVHAFAASPLYSGYIRDDRVRTGCTAGTSRILSGFRNPSRWKSKTSGQRAAHRCQAAMITPAWRSGTKRGRIPCLLFRPTRNASHRAGVPSIRD